MGVFDDDKLGQLDWMSQMTETIDSDLNATLAKLPDRVAITAVDILPTRNSYLSLSVGSILEDYIERVSKNVSLSWEEDNLLQACYAFEVVGDAEIDIKTGVLSGKITLVKLKQTFSDEELQPLMGKKGIAAIGRSSDYGHADAPIDRLNEILEILGGRKEAMNGRSGKKKVAAIKERLVEIFKTNEWRIRDMALSNKVGFWIKGYIDSGNLCNLVNLTKLKVMTHNNMPIYSVKEEV